MVSKAEQDFVKKILSNAGITLNGNKPYDIKVNNDRFYNTILTGNTLKIGESYMAGDWDSDKLDELLLKIIKSDVPSFVKQNFLLILKARIFSFLNSRKSRAFEIGERHYDLGNDLFKAMLDKRMVYTCGYWENAKNLEEEQENKLDLVCRKIHLKKGMKILDIGGGWGSFAKYAAEKYKVKVVNITVSKEQVALANKLTKGLQVENRLQDYRDINEKFDRIVSLGMFEHVGSRNYKTYMETVDKNLKEGGLFLLHTIGKNKISTIQNEWLNKYIFPNYIVPSHTQITQAAENHFTLEDIHNFGPDYARTLMSWNKNFEKNWPKLKEKYGETFRRMWRLYLLGTATSFRARSLQLYQIVFSKNIENYKSVR